MNFSDMKLKLEPSNDHEILLSAVSDSKKPNPTDEATNTDDALLPDLDGINYGDAKNNTYKKLPPPPKKQVPSSMSLNLNNEESKYKKKSYYGKNSSKNSNSAPSSKANQQSATSNASAEFSLDKSLGHNTNSLLCFKETLVPLISQQQVAKTIG